MAATFDTSPILRCWDRDIQPDARGRYVHPDDAPDMPVELPPLLEAGVRQEPSPLMGNLVGGKLFLLALNPGFDAVFRGPGWNEWLRRMRSGRGAYQPNGTMWFQHKTAWIGPWAALAPHAVKVNRYAYATKDATGPVRRVLHSLPTSRLMGEWARDVLFPAARRGDCAVLVTRSHAEWGVTRDQDEGAALLCRFLVRQAVPRHEDRPRMVEVIRDVLGMGRRKAA